MSVAAPVGKEILPGGRDFPLLARSTPGSGGEERSDEVPVPGVGTWFARPLRGENGPEGNSSSESRVPVSNFPAMGVGG